MSTETLVSSEKRSKKLRRAAYVALPHSLPILAGYGFLGLAYGISMSVHGFHPLYSLMMSAFIFGGSAQIVAISLLTSGFDPINTFVVNIVLSARHLFYGISMLEKYRNLGFKKIYMIFGMVDETFSINYSAEPPSDVDRGWFMFFVTLFNHIYWIIGSTIGAVFGTMINFNTEGIEFVMTAMFVVIFLGQWQKDKKHFSSISGLLLSAICLIVFGKDNFIIPSMIAILIALAASKGYLQRKEGAENEL